MKNYSKLKLITGIFTFLLFSQSVFGQLIFELKVNSNLEVLSTCEYYNCAIIEETDSAIVFLWWDKDVETPTFINKKKRRKSKIMISLDRPYRVHIPYDKEEESFPHYVFKSEVLIVDEKRYVFLKYRHPAGKY